MRRNFHFLFQGSLENDTSYSLLPRLPKSYHAYFPETSDLRSQTGLFEGWLSFY
jgi:hypothetical protein